MIKELSHVLDTHEMTFVVRKDKEVTRVVVLPKLLDVEKKSDDDIAALQQPLVISGTPEELDKELADKVLSYVNVLKEGGSNLDAIQKEMDKAVAEKKKKAAPKATKKPAKKTKAQLKDEARNKQAETKGQTDMFSEEGGRLDATTGTTTGTTEKKDDLDDLLEGI